MSLNGGAEDGDVRLGEAMPKGDIVPGDCCGEGNTGSSGVGTIGPGNLGCPGLMMPRDAADPGNRCMPGWCPNMPAGDWPGTGC